MRKKSFWLSSNLRNPRGHPGRRPVPPRGALRPPRHTCIRRPASSEAPGRCDPTGGRKRTSRHTEPQPRRRSPFPFVSSSMSSSVSCGFPRLFRSLLRPRGSVPGSALRAVSSTTLRPSSSPLKSYSCLSLRSGAAQAASRILPAVPVSALPRPALRRARAKIGWPVSPPPSGDPVYHPAPASCSARLLFVSFMVCISNSFCLFVQFVFSSFRSLLADRSVSFVLSSFFLLRLLTCVLVYYFSRILYT